MSLLSEAGNIGHPRARGPRLAVTLFLLLWAAATVPGVLAMRGIAWPHDHDGFRDLTIAESMRVRSWRADPFYAGETAWYSPLVPGIVAAASGLLPSVRDAYVGLGPWLNAIAPLAFFLCARRLVGVWPALAATSAFLLLPGRPPSWASATYSPWLFPAVTAQGPLFLGLLAWTAQLDAPAPRRSLLAGALLGLTFLAHTAGALLLGGIVAVSAGVPAAWPPDTPRSVRLRALGLAALAALSIALPFLLPIAAQYGFRTMNRAPATWVYDALRPGELWLSWIRPSSLIELAVIVAGARSLWRGGNRRTLTVMAAWGTVAAIGLCYGYAAERWAALPPVVPAYHFYFLLRAWQWVLFGCGFIAAAEALTRRVAEWRGRPMSNTAAAAVLLVVLALALYPRYLGREAFTRARGEALRYGREETDAQNAHRWIRERSHPGTVFLAADLDALRIVGPAGRRVVSVGAHFSNPYVDHAARARARDRMWAALRGGDRAAFDQDARQFGVGHVLARSAEAADILAASRPWVHRVFASGDLVVLRTAGSPE